MSNMFRNSRNIDHFWGEALLVGIAIGIAVVLIRFLAPDNLWLRVFLLSTVAALLAGAQFALIRWQRRPPE